MVYSRKEERASPHWQPPSLVRKISASGKRSDTCKEHAGAITSYKKDQGAARRIRVARRKARKKIVLRAQVGDVRGRRRFEPHPKFRRKSQPAISGANPS
jgi:hypothetical protein